MKGKNKLKTLNDLKNIEIREVFRQNLNYVTPVEAVKASKIYGTSTSVVTITYDVYGSVGNNFSMAIVSADVDGPLALAFNPQTQTLVVTPARSGGSDTTTGALLATAINSDATISAFVTASAGGAGVMAAAAAATLEGGVDGNINAIAARRTIGSGTSVLTLTHKNKGIDGENFNIDIVSSSATTASLALDFDKITQTLVVTPARSGGSDTTTGAQLVTAINADAVISEYVTASAGGVGVMAETCTAVSLWGGVNGMPGVGGLSTMFSANGLTMYRCNADATVNDTGKWSKVTMTLAE